MGLDWQELSQVALVTSSNLERSSIIPDAVSIVARLRSATFEDSGNSTSLEVEHHEAVRQYDLAFQLLEEPSADPQYTYSIFEEALKKIRSLPKVPKMIGASLELGMALCLIGGQLPDLPSRNAKVARQIEAHLEAALAVLRVHAQPEDVETLSDALFLLSDCKLDREPSRPRYEKAIPPLREAVQRLNATKHQLKQAKYKTILAAYLHAQTRPNWKEAVELVLEAITVFESQGEHEDLVWSLRQLAWIYQAHPQPQPKAAVAAYRAALEGLKHKSQRELRADTLKRLADCLDNFAPEGSEPWQEIEEVMREATGIWRELFGEQARSVASKRRSQDAVQNSAEWPQSTHDFVFGLFEYAELLTILPQPRWEEAAKLYAEAERATPRAALTIRAFALYQRAFCLENQARPNWDAAIAASRQAVEHFRTASSRANWLSALQQLAFLLGKDKTEELMRSEERVECYRQIVILLEEILVDKKVGASEKRMRRGHLAAALFNLAHSLHHRSFYEKDADEVEWRYRYDAAWRAAETFEALKDKAGQADAVRLTFSLLVDHPKNAAQAHLESAHRVLKWLSAERFPEARADLLHHLSFVLYQEPRREWARALEHSQEAVAVLRERRRRLADAGASAAEINFDDLAEVVGQLGAIYQTQPHSDLKQAAECYRESIALMVQPQDDWRRAETLELLARTLFCDTEARKGEMAAAVWQELVECLESCAQIWESYANPESQSHLIRNLPILALAHISATPPNYGRASEVARRALELGESQMDVVDKGRIKLLLARSLSRKTLPDTQEALLQVEAVVVQVSESSHAELSEPKRNKLLEIQDQAQKLEQEIRRHANIL